MKKRAKEIPLFEVEQLVPGGGVAPRKLLPSVRYHTSEGELPDGALDLPWGADDPAGIPGSVTGELARDMGSRVPGRLVASAKSWLSHAGVDRSAPILPWGAPEDVPKISPVAASASYLAHVRAAWNHRHPEEPLEKQSIVLTVPASFDADARSLTVEAARAAGLPEVRLLEEPQAACYDWLHHHQGSLLEQLAGVRLLLVVDVGGGTTDLTLIRIDTEKGEPRLTRIAVGDHLMLGGDNMDLTLAHHAESQLGQERLSSARLSQLIQQCRMAKERVLSEEGPERVAVTLLGSGSRLVGGARTVDLAASAVREMLVDGFFPFAGVDEKPQGRRSGIVEFGLRYAADPGITRHIAAFLSQHGAASREALGLPADAPATEAVPDAVLLNGGVFHAERFSRRLIEVLSSWGMREPRLLKNETPDLAVARGAVAYGLARRGKGLRIGGGAPRSYFLVVSGEGGKQQGVCLLPRGTEEDQAIELTQRAFSLRIGQPVRFHLVTDAGDTAYAPGTLTDLEQSEFNALPPMATVIEGPGTGEVSVRLSARLSEVGTLDLGCRSIEDRDQKWDFAFQLRTEERKRDERTVHPRFREASHLIHRLYGNRSKDVNPKEIRSIRTDLEKILGKREEWETPLLRELFSVLLEAGKRRRRSADHERHWFGLAGFCLRPGYGYPLDEWRMTQLWAIQDLGIQYSQETPVWSEWWTMWRRVAGGLDETAQKRLFADISKDLATLDRKSRNPRRPGFEDLVRLAGSLERVPPSMKVEAGERLLSAITGSPSASLFWWTIGRLGARVPLYGTVHSVVDREVAESWARRTLGTDWGTDPQAAFAAVLLSRASGDRERDLDASLRSEIVTRLRAGRLAASWIRMVEEPTGLDEADEKRMFGESLPPGLRLIT